MMLVFVTCQTNDDIPHILNFSGEQSLVIGLRTLRFGKRGEAITEFNGLEGITPAVKEKILCLNFKTLYAL